MNYKMLLKYKLIEKVDGLYTECINDPKWIHEWDIVEIEHRIATFIHGLYPDEHYKWLLQERDRLKGDAP